MPCASPSASSSASSTRRPWASWGSEGRAARWPDRLYEMLGRSDVVVIALPLTKATRHLFSRDLFRRMRPTGILVNVTRGEIIYGDDLLAALDEGLLWGAALDVTDPEPLPKGHRLWTHPRVIVTPHTAGGSPRRGGRASLKKYFSRHQQRGRCDSSPPP